jgi:hypothetical protein
MVLGKRREDGCTTRSLHGAVGTSPFLPASVSQPAGSHQVHRGHPLCSGSELLWGSFSFLGTVDVKAQLKYVLFVVRVLDFVV